MKQAFMATGLIFLFSILGAAQTTSIFQNHPFIKQAGPATVTEQALAAFGTATRQQRPSIKDTVPPSA